ncbi:unnamed protein product [Protopolystoma xenopodis]|uniref:Uncharacterized protein n=1 Tax=Protopolystoma xenopodis TaxID=117903 RepID=A0A448X821_9PLAT|nr:unnamed protein product [Protopolystoma xenopodis]
MHFASSLHNSPAPPSVQLVFVLEGVFTASRQLNNPLGRHVKRTCQATALLSRSAGGDFAANKRMRDGFWLYTNSQTTTVTMRNGQVNRARRGQTGFEATGRPITAKMGQCFYVSSAQTCCS